MKPSYIIVFIIGVWLFSACLSNTDETITLVAIPEYFLDEWSVAVRCADYGYDAIQMPFNLQNTNAFWSVSEGRDYYGSSLQISFTGFYNPVADSLFGKLILTDSKRPNFRRQGTFGLRWSTYTGGYFPIQFSDVAQSHTECLDEMRFIFKKRLEH
jgi:hypothetical protein